MSNAIEQIYDQLTQVFGGTNPNQIFTMLMPGTTLDSKTYAYDTTQTKPAIVVEAESKLVDQMFDVTPVSDGNNGQRVSSQYLQALSVLVPNFNPMMPALKKALRDFLNTPVPANTMLDDKPFTGTLQQYYFKLYDNYIAVKQEWEKQILDKKAELQSNPATEKELYLEWYEQFAEAALLKIDEAMGKILAVFSPSDMDAILGALAAGPGGEIEEAANIVKDIQLASPNGGFFYPVDLTPDDWFLDLVSDIDPVNLLKDPEFIGQTITAKRQALAASISQVRAMLNDMPTKGDIKAAADNLQTAQKAYTDAQNNLLNTYADNTATAVEIYLSKHNNDSSQPDGEAKSELDENAVKVSKAKGENPPARGATKKGGEPITKEDVQQIVAGQKTLISAQSTLQSSSQAVADAGLNLASEQASYFGDLPIVLAKMQAQLAEIDNLQDDLATSISAAGSNSLPELAPTIPKASITTATDTLLPAVIKAAQTPNATPADVVTAVTSAVGSDTTNLKSITDAATSVSTAQASPASVIVALEDSIAKLTTSADKKAGRAILTLAQTAAAADDATAQTVLGVITNADKPPTGSITVDCTAAAASPATAKDVLAAVTTAVNALSRTAVVKKSDASERFMELQFSFSSDDMTNSTGSDTSFTQTSWGVDLFFGSASGSSSSSSAVTTKDSLDNSTEIKIGLKAARVDIERGWMDPGVFKLSKDMSRISSDKVSAGSMPDTSWDDKAGLKTINRSIFPSFPTAFLIVKDVNITFKATESSLDAVHTVLDSRSSVGGGFLCFSASKSSASHSDHSSMTTKTQDTVVNISMPGPQILGWYLELTPEDNSTELSLTATASGTDEINLIQFINQLTALNKSVNESDSTKNFAVTN